MMDGLSPGMSISPFSEGEGMVAKDTSPNGFEANLQGDYKWVDQGKVGGAIELTAGVAIVPGDDRLDVEQITVMAWIFPTSITPENTGEHWTGSNMIYDKSGNSDDSIALALMEDDGAYLYINSGPGDKNRMGPFDGADVNNTLSLPDAGVQANQWQHIAGVFDGVNIQIYLNGELTGGNAHPWG
ncbi:LamG-like jellyroll fold domain-containing protein, partial [Candidatus Poribacteria bacterium]